MTTSQIKIINGDCTEVLRRLRSACIDLVVTDPPYLVSYRSRDGRSIRNDDKSGSWLKPAFAEIARVLKPDRFCVSFYGWNQVDRFLSAWKEAGLYPVEHFTWLKSYASSERFARRTHECAYLLAKGRPRRPSVMLDDVLPWRYSGNKLHPTQKPVAAIEPLIGAFSKPGEIVLDPFLGSGTTGRSAERLGRRFLGIELDPEYYRIAAERLKTASSS